jgi:hypothetical protein
MTFITNWSAPHRSSRLGLISSRLLGVIKVATNRRSLLVQPLETVKTKRLLWAWEDTIPLGVVSLLGGRAGIGKSTFLAWLTAQVSNGTLEGDLKNSPRQVTFIAGEDEIDSVLVPRLQAAGANLANVNAVSALEEETDGTHWVSMPNVRKDLADLKTVLYESGTTLLIIDPLSATMEGDTNSEQVVRSQLGRLAHLAGEMNIAILAVKHWHKGAGESIDRISGSHGFTDIVRSVLQLVPDEQENRLILTADKNNYGPRKPSFAFRLDTVEVPIEGDESNPVGKAIFLGETETRVSDILKREAEDNLGDTNKSILDFLRANGASNADAISAGTGIPSPKVRTYLDRLMNSGFVERTSRGIYTPVGSVTSVKSDLTDITHITPLEGIA